MEKPKFVGGPGIEYRWYLRTGICEPLLITRLENRFLEERTETSLNLIFVWKMEKGMHSTPKVKVGSNSHEPHAGRCDDKQRPVLPVAAHHPQRLQSLHGTTTVEKHTHTHV